MAKRITPEEKIISATMELIAEQGWRALSLDEIAEQAKVKLPILRKSFSSKEAILERFRANVDAAVLEQAELEDWQGETPRDRLFDVIMTRFDELEPAKSALKQLSSEIMSDPIALLAGARGTINSMDWMLKAARIEPTGLRRLVMSRGLSAIYARIFQIWLEDDDPGMPRTMAELDKRLRQAESLFARLPVIGFSAEPEGDAA